jgi:hypothetical protein
MLLLDTVLGRFLSCKARTAGFPCDNAVGEHAATYNGARGSTEL